MNIKKSVAFIAVGTLVASSLALKPQQDPRDIQAVLIKVVRDVAKKSPARAWEKAVPADRLRSGYQLRTDDKSLAMIVFPDQSRLVVRQKSIVEIKGQKEKGQIVESGAHNDLIDAMGYYARLHAHQTGLFNRTVNET